MARVRCDMAMSVDGFAAGPNQRLDTPFGDGVEGRLHRWMFEQADENAAQIAALTGAGAYIMGRNMFGPGRGAWDTEWKGWWGDEPPYHGPVFVLTHHPREPLPMQGGTTFHFITDGIESALEQARDAAGDADFIADAGGNAVVRVSKKGAFTTVAAFPPTLIGADAVPTSVVRGPDGALYVSQLTGVPFEKGAANIWRVVPGQRPTVFASGLTNLTDLAFARDGSLYAVEIASNGLFQGPIGSLVKVTPGSSQHQTVAGGLFAPYGVALTKTSAYVTTCAVCVGVAR